MTLKQMLLSLTMVSFLAFSAPAQTITGATNAASFIAEGLPNGGLAQGGVATFFVMNVPLNGVVIASSFPLDTTLDGVSVTLNSGGNQFSAIPIVLAPTEGGAGQVSAIIPSNMPPGQATAVVTSGSVSTSPYTVTIVEHALGIFALNEGGTGPGIFTNPLENNAVNLLTAAYSTNDLADIWATGLGAVSGDEAGGPLPGNLSPPLDVKVFVGGQEAEVLYAGRSGCCAGLDQIRFRIPEGVEGCYVPVVVVVNGVPSNTVTMSISNAGNVCSDAFGLTPADIQNAVETGGLSIGTIDLSRTAFRFPNPVGGGFIEQVNDSGGASFERFTDRQLISVQSFTGLFSRGACIVFQFEDDDEDDGPVDPDDIDPVKPVQQLDAGPVINILGPNGARTLPRESTGDYFADLGGTGFGATQPLYLGAGSYTFDNGAGGNDIGGFSKQADFPDPLAWTNRDEIQSIASSQDLLVTWTGGQGTVVIFGTSVDTGQDMGAGFFCQADAAPGQFSVPSWVIDSLPPSALEEGIPTGILGVGNTADPVRFDAPNLDVGWINYSSMELKLAGYHITVPDQPGGGDNGETPPGGGGNNFAVSSSSFPNGGTIPAANACTGTNQSPELTFANAPDGTESFLVLMDDIDANNFVHWALWDIPGTTTSIPAGNPGGIGTAGQNEFGQTGYGGPCPPPGTTHNYRIRVFALPTMLDLPAGTPAAQYKILVDQFSFLALGTATYTGTFSQ